MARKGLVTCPYCESSNVRTAHAHGFWERLQELTGIYPFRCRDCGNRFKDDPLGFLSFTFAKCPRCLRSDLTTWDAKHYRAPLSAQLKLWLGASRWRCEPCRHNFASWRPRRKKYARPAIPEYGAEDEKRGANHRGSRPLANSEQAD